MRIKDITIEDVKQGKNWMIINTPENHRKGTKMENQEIVPLDAEIKPNDVVYSGLYVYLKENEDSAKKLSRFFKRRNFQKNQRFPPYFPADLKEDMTPIVIPYLMVKDISSQCWDYFEYTNGRWQQLGLRPDPYTPVSIEFVANPPNYDSYFDVCDDNGPIRDWHHKCFYEWIRYL